MPSTPRPFRIHLTLTLSHSRSHLAPSDRSQVRVEREASFTVANPILNVYGAEKEDAMEWEVALSLADESGAKVDAPPPQLGSHSRRHSPPARLRFTPLAPSMRR